MGPNYLNSAQFVPSRAHAWVPVSLAGGSRWPALQGSSTHPSSATYRWTTPVGFILYPRSAWTVPGLAHWPPRSQFGSARGSLLQIISRDLNGIPIGGIVSARLVLWNLGT
jgi:hypothetical protein